LEATSVSFENLRENLLQERPTQLLPGGGADEYVPPLQSSGGAHPLSINLWNSPAHATPPTSRPPSPPRPKLVRECFIIHSRILKPLVP